VHSLVRMISSWIGPIWFSNSTHWINDICRLTVWGGYQSIRHTALLWYIDILESFWKLFTIWNKYVSVNNDNIFIYAWVKDLHTCIKNFLILLSGLSPFPSSLSLLGLLPLIFLSGPLLLCLPCLCPVSGAAGINCVIKQAWLWTEERLEQLFS